MKKKERAFIQHKIGQYRQWAKEEESTAKLEKDPEFKRELYYQARLNETAADILELLLGQLQSDLKVRRSSKK